MTQEETEDAIKLLAEQVHQHHEEITKLQNALIAVNKILITVNKILQ